MSNPTLIKTFDAPAPVAGRTIVKVTAAGVVAAAAANTDAILGVSEKIGSRADDYDNGRVDVILDGIAEVIAGGNITVGALVTSDASGHAVTGDPSAHRILGVAMASAVDGDWLNVKLSQS